MVFHPVSRFARRLAGGLLLLAVLGAVAIPAHAAPRAVSSSDVPTFQLLDWLQGLWGWFGFGLAGEAASAPEEPSPVFDAASCAEDPNGATCPDSGGSTADPVLVEGLAVSPSTPNI